MPCSLGSPSLVFWCCCAAHAARELCCRAATESSRRRPAEMHERPAVLAGNLRQKPFLYVDGMSSIRQDAASQQKGRGPRKWPSENLAERRQPAVRCFLTA